MKLYYCKTTNPRKVCALAKYLELDVEYEFVDLFSQAQHQPEFLSVNPNRKVPVLFDGEKRIFESTAIMAHMAIVADSGLWPSEAQAQVNALQWLTWDIAHLSRHASTLYFEQIIKAKAGIGSPNPEAIEEAVNFFRQFAKVLDDQLDGQEHVLDAGLSIVDFGLACVMTVAREEGLEALPIQEFANISQWLERMDEIPAWRAPWPS
ncbi:MAG: glutathione S-transferase family protein [Pseudomonadales bacterium]|nr:glutathione S-transferase family protein [Pseudomonadales bacterium]